MRSHRDDDDDSPLLASQHRFAGALSETEAHSSAQHPATHTLTRPADQLNLPDSLSFSLFSPDLPSDLMITLLREQ